MLIRGVSHYHRAEQRTGGPGPTVMLPTELQVLRARVGPDRVFLHLCLEHEPLKLCQQFLVFGKQGPGLRRHTHDSSSKADHFDGLHLPPATSRFQPGRSVHRLLSPDL